MPDEGEDGISRINLLDPQIRAMESEKRICAFVGGTGAGKTWLGPHKWLKRVRERPGCRSMAIGMQYERHVVNVMQKALTDFLDAFQINYKLVTGKRLILPGYKNSEIIFGSAEKPESLEGPHLDGLVWMDEAGYMSPFAYEVARRRSGFHADLGTQLYISTIPYLPGWLKQQVYEPWLAGDPNIDWIHARSVDNPKYSLAEIEHAFQTWRPEKFATIYLGEFAKPYGQIYPVPESDGELLFDQEVDFPEGMPEDWPCFAGHDFGVNAPTTGVWGRLDPDNDILYVIAEYERGGMSGLDHYHEWRALGLDFVDVAFGDPSNPDVWLTLSTPEIGYPVIAGENAVLYGIDCVYDRMATLSVDHRGRPSRRLRVARGLNTLLDYRQRYIWDTETNDPEQLIDKPKKPQQAEHLMDALRYLCVGIVLNGVAQGPPVVSANRKDVGA